jgi:hypothetical protein
MNYDWWNRALAGEKVGGPTLPVHDSDAQPGFWRRRASRGGPFLPVAIWEQDGNLVALSDGHEADAGEIWSFVCRYPVSEEAYRQRVETGRWPDEDKSVVASMDAAPASQEIGANNPPTDEAEILKGQIEAASAGVSEYSDIRSDESAAKAQGLRSRLLELSGQADKAREAKKRPFFEAGKAIDLVYQPLVKSAKTAADAVRDAIGQHETRKLRAAEEARKAAEEARIKADREGIKAGKPVPTPAPPPPPPVGALASATTIRGAYGRAATKKLIKKAKVVDYDKAIMALKSHPEIKELVTKLAQRAVDAGVMVDGVEFEEVVDVR